MRPFCVPVRFAFPASAPASARVSVRVPFRAPVRVACPRVRPRLPGVGPRACRVSARAPAGCRVPARVSACVPARGFAVPPPAFRPCAVVRPCRGSEGRLHSHWASANYWR
ncbi:hypothetical protein SCA03_66060 [Streptomyces cacaoi]|uniref:Uncharacterized protein n=1 Tax=Streptomyces cacaoi TaxID=1898 RepID=A0A4Y3R8J1_STRCI|nr:hypothetical protein SCA03_66060 [Streptomyces cacaoi]